MKKIIGILLAALMLSGCLSVYALPAATADINVTFSDNDGKIILVQEKITVTDRNGDGKIDIDEALYATHEAKYEGGAAAGYASAEGQFGLSVTKLWGDTSGNFGYYVNNKMANGPTDELKSGDYLNAFVYQVCEYDPITYETTMDNYSFFDKFTATVTECESLTVTLTKVVFDDQFKPQNEIVAGATIIIDGEKTNFTTGEDGKVTIPMDKAGKYLISAKKTDDILVPPVLKVTVNEKAQTTPATTGDDGAKSPKTGDDISLLIYMMAISGALAVFAAKKVYAK